MTVIVNISILELERRQSQGDTDVWAVATKRKAGSLGAATGSSGEAPWSSSSSTALLPTTSAAANGPNKKKKKRKMNETAHEKRERKQRTKANYYGYGC
jgi:hypothetical protein